MKKKIIKYMSVPTRFTVDEKYCIKDDKDEWNNWNYNVGHSNYIEDRNNPDIIALMSYIMQPEYQNIIMIYNPCLYNNFVTKNENSYVIHSGTINIYPFNEINIINSK